MTGRRAMEILSGFVTGQLAFTAEEIDELLELALVVEADPDVFAELQFVEPVMLEHVELPLGDSTAPTVLATRLGEIDEKLKSSWSRLTTSDAKVQKHENERRTLRRALVLVNDTILLRKMIDLAAQRAKVATGTSYLPCAALGDELYALTAKGSRVNAQLSLRIDRFADYPLSAFLKSFDKTETKMAEFSGQIATLSANVGYVKKNPHQVVIGLAKSGLPASEAITTYRQTRDAVGAPDVAVTLTRNAAALGSTQEVANRLHQAQQALHRAGIPNTPEAIGAAKTLLPFQPLEVGVQRFTQILTDLQAANFCQQRLDVTIKATARLMAAEGTPEEVVGRVNAALQALYPRGTQHPAEALTAVALASMVRDEAAIGPLTIRFTEIAHELVRSGVSLSHLANGDALECVACAGTPAEVVDTVRALALQVAGQQHRLEPTRADVAVAVSFAKRFAY